MAQFDPKDKDVDYVLKALSEADKTERNRILLAEAGGKKRKTILEKYGFDSDARYDATGRKLYPWEVVGDDMADADVVVEETEEARVIREATLAQAEADAKAASVVNEQGGSSAPGSSVAPTTNAAGAPLTA